MIVGFSIYLLIGVIFMLIEHNAIVEAYNAQMNDERIINMDNLFIKILILVITCLLWPVLAFKFYTK